MSINVGRNCSATCKKLIRVVINLSVDTDMNSFHRNAADSLYGIARVRGWNPFSPICYRLQFDTDCDGIECDCLFTL